MKKYIVSFVTFITLFYGGQFVFAQNLTDGDPSNDVCINLQTQVFRYRSSDTTTNGEVSVLQDFLIDKGLLSGQATGFYGRATVAAVKNYQRQVGVSPTGNVGPLTKSIIQKETCTNGGLGNGGSTNPVSNPTVITPSIPGMLNVTYYYLNSNKDGCGKGVFVGNTGAHVQNGQFVYQLGEYKTEAECKNAYNLTQPTGIMCTMEARLCPDGGTMYRDSNCGWHPEQCRNQNGNNKVTIESVGSNAGIGFYSIILSGNNFNQVNYIEEEHLVDGKQTISRSSFTSSSNNSIVFPLQVCQGCKYTSYINAIDKNGIKSNILPFLIDNTTPVPANALKAMSATLYNTKTSYAPGETIRFSLQGYDSNGQVATPAKGFNVQYHMYDMGVNGQANGVTTMINGIYQADNAVFNYNTSMWDITATAPNENLPSGSMRTLEASFYCSSTGLGCYENQIEKSFMFSVVSKVSIDARVTNFTDSDGYADNYGEFTYAITGYSSRYALRVTPNLVCGSCSNLESYRVSLSAAAGETYTNGQVNFYDKDGIYYMFTGTNGRISVTRNINDNVGLRLKLEVIDTSTGVTVASTVVTPTVKG